MAGTALGTPHQFAGGWGYEREENGALGLDYLYQRYYDPAAGRFISRDPIGWAGGLNLYGYCDNDPVNSVDPSGLSPENWGESIWKAPFRALMALFGDCKFRPDAPSFRNANSFYGPHLRRAGAEIYQFTEDQGSGITNQVLLGGLQMGIVGAGSRCQSALASGPPVKYVKHHVLPQAREFTAFFVSRRIKIHKYCMKIPQSRHLAIHPGWNAEWSAFMRANQNATPDDIFRFAGYLVHKYDLNSYRVVSFWQRR